LRCFALIAFSVIPEKAFFMLREVRLPVFENYIQKGTQRLRMGYTTGTCAALAAKAAAMMLLTDTQVDTATLVTPKGIAVEVPVLDSVRTESAVSCAVRKDAGDDPDITDSVLVYAEVRMTKRPGISIDGGIGVGRVTKPGLDQPVGAAAINSVPRRMIEDAVLSCCDALSYEGGLSIVISIPEGENLARRTFNPKLGIDGGISVLGTSGIVEPMSAQALIDCIGLELRALYAGGARHVELTPGNYGEAFLKAHPFLNGAPTVKCSNYIGEAIDFAISCGFETVLLVGHLGKFVKLAGGIMNTHSSNGDCRKEILTAHAALSGADLNTVRALMNTVTTDDGIDILDKAGLREAVLRSLLLEIQEQLFRRAAGYTRIGAMLYTNIYGYLGQTSTVKDILHAFV
jgi:cobalt-precorrin-5B (C1)-methyltransferase